MNRLKLPKLFPLKNLTVTYRIASYLTLSTVLVITSCSVANTYQQKSSLTSTNSTPIKVSQAASTQWQRLTESETEQAWDYILDSPLGIAALNQLAIEGFINPNCTKTFYQNQETGGFQFLMRVQCPNERGASTAVGYDEMRVIFNRFESSIDNFEVERVLAERPPSITLPD